LSLTGFVAQASMLLRRIRGKKSLRRDRAISSPSGGLFGRGAVPLSQKSTILRHLPPAQTRPGDGDLGDWALSWDPPRPKHWGWLSTELSTTGDGVLHQTCVGKFLTIAGLWIFMKKPSPARACSTLNFLGIFAVLKSGLRFRCRLMLDRGRVQGLVSDQQKINSLWAVLCWARILPISLCPHGGLTKPDSPLIPRASFAT